MTEQEAPLVDAEEIVKEDPTYGKDEKDASLAEFDPDVDVESPEDLAQFEG